MSDLICRTCNERYGMAEKFASFGDPYISACTRCEEAETEREKDALRAEGYQRAVADVVAWLIERRGAGRYFGKIIEQRFGARKDGGE